MGLAQIESIERRIAGLQSQLEDANRELAVAKAKVADDDHAINRDENLLRDDPEKLFAESKIKPKWPLSKEEYRRYGRQMIIPEVGLSGQLRLKSSSVLLVGAGGLGCPAAAYLAGAGIGTIGVIDGDTVEISNLHRQILHRSDDVGKYKVDSVVEYLMKLNPSLEYIPHRTNLCPENSINIFSSYDVILDCTDQPRSRYMISDTAVLLRKPLVSASALQTSGQLMVLNQPPARQGDPHGGPCYRCVFPRPPPPDSVVGCGEGGILGPVVGVMGVLQALEAIKILMYSIRDDDSSDKNSSSTSSLHPRNPSLLIFSAFGEQPFRTVRLRARRLKCTACSVKSSITEDRLSSGSVDYAKFCGILECKDILSPEERITPNQCQEALNAQGQRPLLIDTREKPHYHLYNIPGSVNVPFSEISRWRDYEDAQYVRALLPSSGTKVDQSEEDGEGLTPINVICQRGNDSQLAVKRFKDFGMDSDRKRLIIDIKGGWDAWRKQVPGDWPEI